MGISFVDIHLSFCKLTSFVDNNCFLNESTVIEYCLGNVILGVLEYASTISLENALYESWSSIFDKAFHGI